MKTIILALAFSSLYLFVNAQEPSVEKSTFGIETGFLGLWINHEARLSDQFTLRTELGLNAGILGNSTDDGTNFVLTPEITLAPRWYYNLKKRKANAKNISNNAANFFSLKTSYSPDWFAFSNTENVNPQSSFSIIPTWGIRRNIGNHFYFEAGAGVGYRHYFGENDFDWKDKIAPNAHLRFGYRF